MLSGSHWELISLSMAVPARPEQPNPEGRSIEVAAEPQYLETSTQCHPEGYSIEVVFQAYKCSLPYEQ